MYVNVIWCLCICCFVFKWAKFPENEVDDQCWVKYFLKNKQGTNILAEKKYLKINCKHVLKNI